MILVLQKLRRSPFCTFCQVRFFSKVLFMSSHVLIGHLWLQGYSILYFAMYSALPYILCTHVFTQIFKEKITNFNFLKILFLFIFRERGREGERERNVNVWLPLNAPYWGPGLQPCLGIKLATFWFAGQHLIH